ncbi:TAT-variant-translocated molybdopterin oxidoreductase [Stigmatella sp. ncwal1]|uniref:TAT-variant-translocated molybdopterin oxidoreductase n=1 Tax=Stigmatella ashevillensis TaxID=2995309 RepID=A0ABT5D8X3_9BACT|nr:TAT-variant-translocated molybdopterin oxidoreductase [Stigmatella ashevillena]MDC0710111.1 TAT-variant-translocated molybdopterin oxidoreductase [Stigmatella ashevillena]
MNPKHDGAPAQDTPSSFALPVVSSQAARAEEHDHDHDHAHGDEVGAALEHAAAMGIASEGGYGRTYWRSLEERLGTDEYMASTGPEFPEGADLPPTGVARREFMQLIGASLALAGASACTTRPPDERIVPFTKTPPEMKPGNPLHYASGMTFAGHTSGLLITAREGRPVKVEGNPQHPINQGAAGSYEQSFLLALYDPQRARVLRQGKSPRSLRTLAETISARVSKADGGAGIRFLTEPLNSPLLSGLRERIQRKLPSARFYSYAPTGKTASSEGTQAVFGQALSPRYDFTQADVILSLDADFLAGHPANLAYIREFGGRRDNIDRLNRLYVAETRYSITGGMADHRLRLKSSEIIALAGAIGQALNAPAAAAAASKAPVQWSESAQKWIAAVAEDLRATAGRSLVVPGDRQPAAVHALAHALNAALGNVGKTVNYVPLTAEHTGLAGIRELVADIKAGTVDTLVITAFNPVYTLPGDSGLAEVLGTGTSPEQRAKLSVIYTSLFEDETATVTDWFVPAAHQLETWSDGRADEGTVAIAQPLLQPLYNGVPESELLAYFLDEPFRPAHQMLREHWLGQTAAEGGDFESRWETFVSVGVVPNTTATPVSVTANGQGLASLISAYTPPQPVGAQANQVEINFVTDYKVYDGRFGNLTWLQELPDPVTRLVWDNPALISPKTATDNNLVTGDVVELSYRGRTLEVPVWILPGHADGAVTLPLGYGRTGLHETVAQNVGFNANTLRSIEAPWFDSGATITKTRKTHKLVSTQQHWSTAKRPVALDFTADEYRAKSSHDVKAALARTRGDLDDPKSEFNNLAAFKYDDPNLYKWGMAIDLSRCTGCSACVVACQAENNIPVVGKDQVSRSREMHWLRIDRYFSGTGIHTGGYDNKADPDSDPQMIHQPVTCVHCEKAPCEYVCPVNATVHSDEGLNDMVYNRCIGTRYCANNCPYKVRRFNYLHYTQGKTPTQKMLMNPDVTVRNRGVMEKCTFCVQRIERTRINARVEKRTIADGELKTACQQTCAAQAITFGSLNDPKSRVSQLHADDRHYKLLYELGTMPRTVHLVRLRNPNPALAQAPKAHEGEH